MKERTTTCCFTGHRPEKLLWGTDELDARCLALKETISHALEGLYEDGFRHFISGMARGCDLYFGEAVLALREKYADVTLEAAVPCETQANGWKKDEKARYDRLLKCSDKVTYVSRLYSPGCMQRRNKYMVDSSAALLAVFNGTSGGTMQTILYARRNSLRIEMIEI